MKKLLIALWLVCLLTTAVFAEENGRTLDWSFAIHQNINVNWDNGIVSGGQAIDIASLEEILYLQVSHIEEKRNGTLDFWTAGLDLDVKNGLQWLKEKTNLKIVYHLENLTPRIHIAQGWRIENKPIKEWESHTFIGLALLTIKL